MLGVRDTFSKILRLESWVIFRFHCSCGNVSHFKTILRQTTSIPRYTKSISQNTKSILRRTRSISRHTTNTLQQTKSMLPHKRSISRHKESIPRHTRSIPRSSTYKHLSLSPKHASLSPKQVSRTLIINNSISEKVSQTLFEVSQTHKGISNSKQIYQTPKKHLELSQKYF